jgi:hypothetical protein
MPIAPGDVLNVGPHRLVCGDSRDPAVRAAAVAGVGVTALIYDPPYADWPLIDALPVDVFGVDDALVFGSCANPVARRVRCALPWRFGFVWDGVQRHCDPGRPLLAHKTCDWFSAHGRYDHTGATDPRDGTRLASVYRESITETAAGTPHAKPIGWLAMLIANCTHGPVLDPFAGWGSSLAACLRLGRPWRGIEQDPARCARIAALFTLQ